LPEIHETRLEIAEIHEIRPEYLEMWSKTFRTLYIFKILKIPEILQIPEVRPEILEIPETRPEIPEILKSGVQAPKEYTAPPWRAPRPLGKETDARWSTRGGNFDLSNLQRSGAKDPDVI